MQTLRLEPKTLQNKSFDTMLENRNHLTQKLKLFGNEPSKEIMLSNTFHTPYIKYLDFFILCPYI